VDGHVSLLDEGLKTHLNFSEQINMLVAFFWVEPSSKTQRLDALDNFFNFSSLVLVLEQVLL
jgi:hypothetical protein